MSESNTPASTSTYAAGNETVTLPENIKRMNFSYRIFAQEGDLGLDVDDLEIISKRKTMDREF